MASVDFPEMANRRQSGAISRRKKSSIVNNMQNHNINSDDQPNSSRLPDANLAIHSKHIVKDSKEHISR